MATMGLFADPTQVQDARLLQMAQLDPNQRLFMGAARGAQQLGRGVGSLFGVDVQDPAVARATKLRELGAKYGTTTAEALDKIAAELQATDPQMAMQVAEKANELRLKSSQIASEQALTAQRMREKAAADPLQKLIQEGKYTPESVSAYQKSGNISDLKLVEKESKINYGPEADRAAVANFGVPFNQLTKEQAKIIDDLLETRGIKKAQAGKTTVDLSGLKDAGDITAFRKDVQSITKPYQDQIDAADDAISLATMAINNKNFAAVSSLSRSLAKASGETQLSGRDVEAFGIDPSLVGRVADTASRLAQSRPTVDTLTKLRQLAEAIKKKAEGRLAVEEEQLQATARASKRFTDEQINTVFRRRPAQGGGLKTSFNSVAEAEAAKLPKGTIITINGRRAVVE